MLSNQETGANLDHSRLLIPRAEADRLPSIHPMRKIDLPDGRVVEIPITLKVGGVFLIGHEHYRLGIEDEVIPTEPGLTSIETDFSYCEAGYDDLFLRQRLLLIEPGQSLELRFLPQFLREARDSQISRHYWFGGASLICTENTSKKCLPPDMRDQLCPICKLLGTPRKTVLTGQLYRVDSWYVPVLIRRILRPGAEEWESFNCTKPYLFKLCQPVAGTIVAMIQKESNPNLLFDWVEGCSFIVGKNSNGRWHVDQGKKQAIGTPDEISEIERMIRNHPVRMPAPNVEPIDCIEAFAKTIQIAEQFEPTPKRAEELLKEIPGATLVGQWFGRKKPLRTKWQLDAKSWMSDPRYIEELNECNIALKVGPDSENICSVDLDSDDLFAAFLSSNPQLAGAMKSRGGRGGNVYVKMSGDYPQSCLKIEFDGQNIGEFRGGRCLTTLSGLHTSGRLYTVENLGAIPSMDYQEIVWPTGWSVAKQREGRDFDYSDEESSGECILDVQQLKNVRKLSDGGINAQCPACAARGSDKSGNHLKIFPSGRYGCAVDQSEGHKRTIFHVAGRSDLKKGDYDAENQAHTPVQEEAKITFGGRLEGASVEKEIVILPGHGVEITQTANHLFELIAPSHEMFIHSGRVVVPVELSGNTSLDRLKPVAAQSRFEKYARLMAYRAGRADKLVLQPTICTLEVAQALLATQQAFELLPPIEGLLNFSFIHDNNGRVRIVGKGYDPLTRKLVTSDRSPQSVPLDNAIDSLKQLFTDFDFATAADFSRALASLLTPALKVGGFIQGRVPMDVAEADQSQAGKGYRHRLLTAIYNEVPAQVSARKGGVGSVDESFDQQLLYGKPFIEFDNFRGNFQSTHLEAFLTGEGAFYCRVPHGKGSVNRQNYFLMLTSNGVDTSRDLANRSNIIRIRKRPSGFEFKKYREGDLLDHVKVNQPYYLGCILSVIRAWHDDGRRLTGETRHDFKEWVRILDYIVQDLFRLPAIMDGHQELQDRVSCPATVFLRQVAIAVAQQKRLGVGMTTAELYDLVQDHVEIPGFKPDNDDRKALRAIGRVMSQVFKETGTVNIEEYRISRCKDQIEREDGNGSREHWFYKVELV